MPVLQPLPDPDIKQLYLPSTADLPEEQRGWVKMDISPMNVQDSFVDVEIGESFGRIGAGVVANRIKEWNYTEADGTPAPINKESLMRLGSLNVNYLVNQIKDDPIKPLSDSEKKS